MSDTESHHDDSSTSWIGDDRRDDVLSVAQTSPSQRILAGTPMKAITKLRVDHATEELSGKRCLIENTDEANIVHYAHCLARATKDHILDALEFSWGMDRRTLNMDTRYNIFRFGSKFHALYDKKSLMYILLPQERILQKYYEARNDRSKFPDINDSIYEYHFLASDKMVSVPIHRLTPPDNLAAAQPPPAAAYKYIPYPYTDLGTVKCHVHPRFIICNAAQKMEGDLGGALAFSNRLYPNHAHALEMVAEIWKAWTTVADKPGFAAFRKKPYTGDNMSSTSRYTSKQRAIPPAKKRGREQNESPTGGSKRAKEGRGQNDCIWLDDETLREHDSKDSPKKQWKNKKVWISDWSKVVSKTGVAEEQDLDTVTNEVEAQ